MQIKVDCCCAGGIRTRTLRLVIVHGAASLPTFFGFNVIVIYPNLYPLYQNTSFLYLLFSVVETKWVKKFVR
jgi:hypothetical protein